MSTLNALVFSNGIEGIEQLYRSDPGVQYDFLTLGPDHPHDFTAYDLLIAPNGTDHVALYQMRREIAEFLEEGKTLFCFDGWFTDWVPGNRWVMDNSQKSKEVRYHIKDDPFELRRHFRIEDLNFSHGISGWWACGYIEPGPGAITVLVDTWKRPLLVIDAQSTNGLMVLTASGPLGNSSYATTDDAKAHQAMAGLYQGLIQFVKQMNVLSV